MASATSRHPIKPKTLTLLELCRSFHDFRHPPASLSSYQSQLAPNNEHARKRRVYLHPLTLTTNIKQHSLKSASNNSIVTLDNDSRPQLNSDRSHETKHVKNRSAFNGLAILSSSAPIRTRTKAKSDNRYLRDKGMMTIEDEINNEFDNGVTTFPSKQFSLHSIARGTSSSTHTACTRPSCVLTHQKAHKKSVRWDKVDVWDHLSQTLERPIPNDPPTTPLRTIEDVQKENDESPMSYVNHAFIHEIKIYQRNPNHKIITNKDTNIDDDDDNDYNNNDDGHNEDDIYYQYIYHKN